MILRQILHQGPVAASYLLDSAGMKEGAQASGRGNRR